MSLVFSDLFGIQLRSGCFCAGPFGITLLKLSEEIILETKILKLELSAHRVPLRRTWAKQGLGGAAKVLPGPFCCSDPSGFGTRQNIWWESMDARHSEWRRNTPNTKWAWRRLLDYVRRLGCLWDSHKVCLALFFKIQMPRFRIFLKSDKIQKSYRWVQMHIYERVNLWFCELFTKWRFTQNKMAQVWRLIRIQST